MLSQAVLAAFSVLHSEAFTPYQPQDNWVYHLEARRAEAWPACDYRFLSYPDDCSSVDMWKGAGVNQAFTLVPSGSGDFFLQTKCGRYLSYPGDCSDTAIDTWAEAGINQRFRIADAGALGWSLEAVGRSACEQRFVGFPRGCSSGSPDAVMMQSAQDAAGWNGHPAGSPMSHSRLADDGCADPFAWRGSDGSYHLICTGGDLPLYSSSSIGPGASFAKVGSMLGGEKPAWAADGARWAPENVDLGNGVNLAVFCDVGGTPDGKHRVGWALSSQGATPGSWTTYSSGSLDLGNAPGGDIDAHVFVDGDSAYLIWKTDDNNVGDAVTRIWAQPVTLSASGMELKGSRQQILDSTGLWWVDSFVAGGSLVEGPEIVRQGDWYYLFFASGRYCQDSYSEGVARSKNVLGPYEKLSVPLLSTNMVGRGPEDKLVGPGHASYLQDEHGDWFTVWHASEGENCNRRAYADKLGWTADGWPFVDFQSSAVFQV